MAPQPASFFLLTSLALLITAVLFIAYLHNYPLSALKTSTISSSDSLSPTALTSPSLHIINPRSHVSHHVSHHIILTKTEIGDRSDEEILATFLKGFYSGWAFTPERGLITSFGTFGRTMVPSGFSGIISPLSEPHLVTSVNNLGIRANGPEILSPRGISRTSLPEKSTRMLGGNAVVLESHVNPGSFTKEASIPSFLEIGFGSDRGELAGMHRFELSHDLKSIGVEEGAVELWFSSVTCNPVVDKILFPTWAFGVYKLYARSLFRDGVAEVLKS